MPAWAALDRPEGGSFEKNVFIYLILWYDNRKRAAGFRREAAKKERGGAKVKMRWSLVGIWLTVWLLVLSGCFFQAPEDLYRSPEQSADYLSLTQTIRAVKDSLSQEYGVEVEDISVMSGNNTALIQLQDLDGDGATETAVTFFRVPEADRPLKIYFFTKSEEDTYTASAVVEGSGSSIYRVDYADLNGSGYKEVVVSWQMNTGAYLLGAYSLDEVMAQNIQRAAVQAVSSSSGVPEVPKGDLLRAAEWMTTAYTDYALYDLNQDTRTEIAVIQVDPAGTNSRVELYGWHDGSFLARDTAPLSAGIISNGVRNVETNFVRGNGDVPVRALYLSSELSDGHHVVDVVAYLDGVLTNLSLTESGVSQEMLDRYVDLDPTDVNGDGVLELPTPIPLPSSSDTSASDFWLIDWSQYTSTGEKEPVCTTYHNIADGWYLVVPEVWKGQITLSRNDLVTGQRAVSFYHLQPNGQRESSPFMVIYKFTSQFSRAETSSRFLLREEEDAVYAAAFYDSSWNCGMDSTQLQTAFHLIQSSWSD